MNKAVISEQISDITLQVIEWRRHLHRYPELSFQEYNTSQFVYDTLQSFGGLEVSRPTETSVMARLIGDHPGHVLAIRADMDALEIHEENDVEYQSENPGVMHACGHDGHTAILLGTAKILSSFQKEIKGEVRFIFQHAEEKPPGGAQEMVKAGALDGVDMIIGAHLWAPLEVGKIALQSGSMMAGGDLFNLTIQGVGGHAGMPHQTVDPIAIAAQVITNLQHMVSREIDPLDQLVVSITKLHAGMTYNVIPDTVEIGGTVRYFHEKYRDQAPLIMDRIVNGITSAHGAAYHMEYVNGYLPVLNDPKVTQMMEKLIHKYEGHDVKQNLRPPMVGEDFSSYLQNTAGCFILIGAGNKEKGIIYPHHHPRFAIDEDALTMGLKVFIYFVNELLGSSSPC